MLPHKRNKATGRPTLYKPEYCEIAESMGKQGKSLMEIASILNVDRKTLYEWERAYEEFAQSLSRARVHSQAWWESKAQKSLGKKQFQAQLWRYSMLGRFKEDYGEQSRVDVTVSLEGIVSALQQREPPKTIEGASSLAPLPAPAKDEE